MKLIGFMVNPIAGMGGSVGLKGTDGRLYYEALKRGAKPVAPAKAMRFLSKLKELGVHIKIISAAHVMGCDYLAKVNYPDFKCLDIPITRNTSSNDTKKVVKEFLRYGVDMITFVGGDGTAKDIYDVVNGSIPLLGIPSGVKMYSGCFAASPEAAAYIIKNLLEGIGSIDLGEVADADEELIQRGIPKVRIYGYVLTPKLEYLMVPSKDFGASGGSEEKYEVAKYFIEEYMVRDTLFLLGPGTTIKAVADILGLSKTLLGVDAVYNGRLVGIDLSETDILKLINMYGKAYIVLTVIGRQGYILGRGNQQFTPRVIRRLGGKKAIYVLATRSKIRGLRYLLIDTGDPELDVSMYGYWRIITGFREERLIKVLPACCLDKFLPLK